MCVRVCVCVYSEKKSGVNVRGETWRVKKER